MVLYIHHQKIKPLKIFIRTKQGIFGNINCFVKYNENFFVVSKQIIRLYNPFYWEQFPDSKCSIDYCYINNSNIVIEEVNNFFFLSREYII